MWDLVGPWLNTVKAEAVSTATSHDGLSSVAVSPSPLGQALVYPCTPKPLFRLGSGFMIDRCSDPQ